MTLPLQLPSTEHQARIVGDVVIAPSAAIAANVLLQANPGCKIVIGDGVCIGSGSVIHAHKGAIEIEQGASLGTVVLLFGQVKIGASACIGTGTTIFNTTVEAFQVIPANSLVGDTSRSLSPEEQAEQEAVAKAPDPNPVQPTPPQPRSQTDIGQPPTPTPPAAPESSEPATDVPVPSTTEPATAESAALVYGRNHVAHLMKTLFPHSRGV